MAQHHHVCQIQTGLHVFKIAHEMLFWTCTHHVKHVTQEDRTVWSLCTFLHIRRRIGYQLVAVHVVDFLCAVNTPGLRRDLEALKRFLAKPYHGRVQLCFRRWFHTHRALIRLASVIDEMHCENLRKQLDFRELRQSWEVRAKSWALAFQRKNLYLSLPFVQIRMPRVSLCRIHPVSVLIPSVLRELVATVVSTTSSTPKLSMLRSSFIFAVCSAFWSFVNVEISILLSPPARANTVFTSVGLWRFWILSSLSAGDNGRAGFGICGPGITIDESVAVPAAAPADEDVCNGSWKVTSWRLLFVDWPVPSGVDVAVSDFGFLVGAVGISMNLGNAPASIGSSYACLCKRGRPGRFRCGDHGVKSMAFNAAGTHLAGSWRRRTALLLMTPTAVPIKCSSLSVSRPSQRPVTHGCISCLTFAPGRRARTCSPSGRISFLYFCPRIFSYGVIRVSLLTLYIVRIHAACLIVHGSIGECVVTVKYWILSLITARYVQASPRTVETAFSAAPLLWWLCVGDTCRTICQSCPSGRHSAFVHQVAHRLGCCCDNVGHVHLLGVQHHRRVDGSRRGVCSRKEARYLQRASITHVPVIKLKLRYNCIFFRLFSMWWIVSSGFDAHLAPGLTRKVCQIVVPSRSDRACQDLWALQDEEASAPQRLPASADSLAFVALEPLCHSLQLSSRAQPSSLWQRTNSLPCATVCGYVSSGSSQERTVFQYLREDHSSAPAERDGQETELVSALHTRGKALELFVLLEVCMSPGVLRHVGVVLHLLCGFQDQAAVSFVLDTWVDRRVAVRHCLEANTRHQLVSLWMTRNWLSHPWSTSPRLTCTRVLQ